MVAIPGLRENLDALMAIEVGKLYKAKTWLGGTVIATEHGAYIEPGDIFMILTEPAPPEPGSYLYKRFEVLCGERRISLLFGAKQHLSEFMTRVGNQ